MENHPKLKEVDSSGISDNEFDRVTKGSLTIKLRDLFPGTTLPFDLYFPSTSKGKGLQLDVILEAGQVYSPMLHESLQSGEVFEVYIKEGDEELFSQYLTGNVQKLVQSSHISSETKTQLLYSNAEAIVAKTFKERPNAANAKVGRQLAGDFASHILADDVSASAVFSLFSKDYDTFTHSVQVAVLGMVFCKFLGMNKEEVADFGLGGLFHDIGKNSIDDAILKKPSQLDSEEFDTVKKHTLMGYQQLRKAQILSPAQLSVVLHHHEAMDGSGYPQGLNGQQIHKYARIAHIVDVYDALTTRRVYKDALPQEQALELMKGEMRHSFDAALLELFFKCLGTTAKMKGAGEGTRLDIELGNQIIIQFEGDEARLKAKLVGMETGEYLILGMPALAQLKRYAEGDKIIARYAHAGRVYGFRSVVLGHIEQPLRLLFMAYPLSVENINLRKDPRVDCFLPAEAEIRGRLRQGVVTDISRGGCKFVAKQKNKNDFPQNLIDEYIVLRTQFVGETTPQTFTGKVRNVKFDEERATLGVQFVELSEEATESLNKSILNVLSLTG